MKLWFRLTIICWALACLFLSLSQQVSWNISRILSAQDYGSIDVEKPRPILNQLR